jgi:hypothetical protein
MCACFKRSDLLSLVTDPEAVRTYPKKTEIGRETMQPSMTCSIAFPSGLGTLFAVRDIRLVELGRRGCAYPQVRPVAHQRSPSVGRGIRPS